MGDAVGATDCMETVEGPRALAVKREKGGRIRRRRLPRTRPHGKDPMDPPPKASVLLFSFKR